MTRTILHIDLDAFFCAVEEQRNPDLRGQPFAVGGRPEGRGVVASCSYAARQFGIHSAMPMSQAVRRCPQLTIIPANHPLYSSVSRRVMAHLRAFTPQVEQLSIDEAFLDVSALDAPAADIAHQIQDSINRILQLPCSLGVAANKLVAKIANTVGKERGKQTNPPGKPPNAIQIVPPGTETAFLAPLPTTALWGVGPKTAQALAELNMHTIGDIARWPAHDLARRFGKHGAALAQRAKGIDDRPVVTERNTKSVSQETTFSEDICDGAVLKETLRSLSDGVSTRLQRKSLTGSTIKLKIRWVDFTTPTRQMTLPQPTDDADSIYRAAARLFDAIWHGEKVRLLGIGVSNIQEQMRQLTLWDTPNDAAENAAVDNAQPALPDVRLQTTLEQLRHRYGEQIVRRGSEFS